MNLSWLGNVFNEFNYNEKTKQFLVIVYLKKKKNFRSEGSDVHIPFKRCLLLLISGMQTSWHYFSFIFSHRSFSCEWPYSISVLDSVWLSIVSRCVRFIFDFDIRTRRAISHKCSIATNHSPLFIMQCIEVFKHIFFFIDDHETSTPFTFETEARTIYVKCQI